MEADPEVGIIYARDKHPSAKRLADLDPESDALSAVLVDAIVPLTEALERVWEQDAHVVQYRLEDDEGDPVYVRASKKAPVIRQLEAEGGRLAVRVLLFDYDIPKDTLGNKVAWGDEGAPIFDDFETSWDKAPPELVPTHWYATRHGARLVYVLDEPLHGKDAEEVMLGMLGAHRDAGLELDTACKDWTRLFRLPSTTREDTGQPYTGHVALWSGGLLETAKAPRVALANAGAYADVDSYVGDMPDGDEVRQLLEQRSASGKVSDTPLVKEARRMLVGKPSLGIVFDGHPMVTGEENWNNQVLRTVGQVVSMLARREDVSAEGIYALLHNAVVVLQRREDKGAQQTDWHAKVWDMICRMWANEQAQIIAEAEELERKQVEGEQTRAEILQKYKVEGTADEDIPEDDRAASEWLLRRLIAVEGSSRFYVMKSDGSYTTSPATLTSLIPMIFELGMDEVIPTSEVRGKQIVQRTAQSIINDHAVPIREVRFSALANVASLEGDILGDRVMVVPVHQLNPKLQPGGVFSPKIHEWLEALSGDAFARVVEWLSHSLDVKRPICALNIWGAAGSGKGLLAQGIAECFYSQHHNDGRVLGKWNAGLVRSPLVHCDEGVPVIHSDEALTPDQSFRSIVTGGRLTIREMRRDPMTALIFPRLLFTSNDRDIIRTIVGHRDLTPDDMEAIQKRLLTMQAQPEATTLLTSRGNYSYTRGWVGGQGGDSNLVLANHIYYLFCNRAPAEDGGNRLLVEGDTYSPEVEEMRFRSRHAQLATHVLLRVVEAGSTKAVFPGFCVTDDGVWALASGVCQYAKDKLGEHDINMTSASRVLRAFSTDPDMGTAPMSRPSTRVTRGRWVEIDVARLYREALRYFEGSEQLRNRVAALPDGANLLHIIESGDGELYA